MNPGDGGCSELRLCQPRQDSILKKKKKKIKDLALDVTHLMSLPIQSVSQMSHRIGLPTFNPLEWALTLDGRSSKVALQGSLSEDDSGGSSPSCKQSSFFPITSKHYPVVYCTITLHPLSNFYIYIISFLCYELCFK